MIKTGFMVLAAAVTFAAPAFAASLGELATPPGVTLEPLGVAQGYELGKQAATFLPREQIVYADPAGRTLYTSDADQPGKSACTDACATEWQPLLAPAGVKPSGKWSVIKRTDGGRQWALAGRALYTFAKDVDPGSVFGNSPARFRDHRPTVDAVTGASSLRTDLPVRAGWTPAMAFPVMDMPLPADFAVKEVPEALGLVLVNHDDMTLYAHGGDPAKDGAGNVWRPAEAPQLSNAVGDFNFIVRADGIKQWSYKGRGLYTYSGDLAHGDANGIGVDKAWEPATIVRYYLPPNISVQTTLARGKVLATATGLTLYRREAHIDQTGAGHNLRRGQPLRPAVGREIGLKNVRCDEDCRAHWHPYAAAAGALAQGQWTVVSHPDGFKQWAYQGYPLWTYDGDKKPGDMNGNDDSTYAFSGMANAPRGLSPQELVDIGTPQEGGAGLYWLIAWP